MILVLVLLPLILVGGLCYWLGYLDARDGWRNRLRRARARRRDGLDMETWGEVVAMVEREMRR